MIWDKIIGRFKFSVGIRQLKCVDNLISIEMVGILLLKMKEQELIEFVVNL